METYQFKYKEVESVADIDVLSVDDLKKLVVEVFEANAALRADNAALREVISPGSRA